MSLDRILDALHRLTLIVGVVGAIALILAALGAVLLAMYMLLIFSENALRHLVPFARDFLSALRSEATSEHPAIRIEIRTHFVLGALAVLSLVFLMAHAIIPWSGHNTWELVAGVLIGSVTLFCWLIPISKKMALRL